MTLKILLSLVKDSGLLENKAATNIPGISNANPLSGLLGGSGDLIGGAQNSDKPLSSVRPFQLLKDIQFGTGEHCRWRIGHIHGLLVWDC